MEEIGHLVAGLEQFVRAYGAAAVLVIIMLEAFGMPLPGESLLIFSAALAGRGEMSLPALLICAWAGAVIGDNVGYVIGRTLGRAAVARFGAKIGLTEARFGWIEGLFARYGALTVMFARFFNVLRQLNGIVAGTLGMSWWRFLVCNAVGAALWVLTWMLGAFYISQHASILAKAAQHIGVVGGADLRQQPPSWLRSSPCGTGGVQAGKRCRRHSRALLQRPAPAQRDFGRGVQTR